MRKPSDIIELSSLLVTLALCLAIGSGCAPRATTVQTPGDTPSANANVESATVFVTSNTDDHLLPSLYTPTGGLAAMKSYFDSEKKDLGDRTVWLDASHLSAELQKESGVSATLESAPSVLSVGAIKLGVFALSQSSFESSGHAGDPTSTLLSQATALRKMGADLVIVLTDLPVDCRPSVRANLKNTSKSLQVRKANEPQAFCNGVLADALKSLPEGTINAAVVSGSGELQHFVFAQYSSSKTAGIPIVASSARGTSGHLLTFSVSKTANNTNFVPENTRIEGPFLIRTQGNFHGKPIGEDSRIQFLLGASRDARVQKKKEILAHFDQELALDPEHESSLADLAADVLRAQTHTDIAIVPLGLFRNAERAKIAAGPFSQADLDRLIPHPTPITTLEVTGEQLRTLLRISETGARGFSGVSGTQLRLLRADQQTPSSDLNGDGKIELWELNRLLSTGSFREQESDNSGDSDTSIQTRKTYRVAVPQALVDGADDWQWASKSMGLAKNSTPPQDFRGLLADWLKQNPSVNFPAPRLKFEKVQAKNKSSHRRHRGGKHVKHRSA
jgi:2',3'-cyclic-nucleotide 2'-phosphodiesterase (5'-nucleotidase family)